MREGRKCYLWVCLLGFFIFSLLSIYISTLAKAEQSTQVPKFEWTKQNPKPDWWAWDDERKKEPVRGGILYQAATRYVGKMNPNHYPCLDWGFITIVYDGISYIDMSQNPRGYWLAKSIKYSDPKTCIMELRPGIQFHDGTPFNAEAVKFNTDYIKDKKNGCWSRRWIEPVESVEVVDELTVKWNFKRPWAGFMGMMSTVPGYMISKKALEDDIALKSLNKAERSLKKNKDEVNKLEDEIKDASGEKEETLKKQLAEARAEVAALEKLVAEYTEKAKNAKDLDKNPVGTGSYMLEDAKPGNYLKLKRNPNWWFGKAMGMDMPFFDGRVTIIIPDESVQLANLRAGKIDFMWPSSTQYLDLKDDPKFSSVSYVSNWMRGLRFNQAKGPCKDIRVRKAISHAIDRKAIVFGLEHGEGVVASGPFQSTHWAHNPNLKPVPYNPELSKKLLKEAGYDKGLTINGFTGTSPTEVSRAEAVKAMLAKVGINWEVVSLDATSQEDRERNLEYDMRDGGWSYIKEPDMMCTTLFHPKGTSNYGRNNIPKVIELVEKGKQEIDIEKRQKIYWELEKVLMEDYTDIWIYYPFRHYTRSNRIMGYEPDLYRKGGEFYSFSHRQWFKDGKRTD